jgi:hypothetical protein
MPRLTASLGAFRESDGVSYAVKKNPWAGLHEPVVNGSISESHGVSYYLLRVAPSIPDD